MACAGITKPCPQSGHVRRTVVPPPSLSAQVAFINNLSPARPRPREPFLCLLRTILPDDLSLPYPHPRFSPKVRPSSELPRTAFIPAPPRILRLPPRLGPFRSSALPHSRTLLHRNSLRRCLSRRRRRPGYDEPDDFRPSDRGHCALGT